MVWQAFFETTQGVIEKWINQKNCCRLAASFTWKRVRKSWLLLAGGIFEDSDSSEQVFADYMGTLYPSGFQKNSNIFFQHENIDRVVFRGYSDEEEKRFLVVYNNWKGTIKVKRAKV